MDRSQTPLQRFAADFARSRLALAGLATLLLILLAALFAPLISPQNPYDLAQLDVLDSRLPPGATASNGLTFWLGSDGQGRDILSGIFYGLRISLGVGAASTACALVIGLALGLGAAFFGGRTHSAIMRLVDIQLAFPSILIALILLALLGQGIGKTTFALIMVQWAYYARAVRSTALAERGKEYIEAAMGLALPPARIVFRHLLPNCLPPVIVIATVQVAAAIALEATLSYLGIGVPITEPSLGLVGESGCGKSVTAFSIMGLVDPPGRVAAGRILLGGRDLLTLAPGEMRAIRGNRIAMIFQDPMMTLNPVLRIDTQMVEAIQAHSGVSRRAALERACEALARVGIAAPHERLADYPHQFSGGMRQRVAIAIALLNQPDLIIADEPTTALDVTIQAQILFEMQQLARSSGTALLWITHDLSVVAGLADEVCVMYAGRIVEHGSVDQVLDAPLHPYTRGLIASLPGAARRGEPLRQIPGMAPSLLKLPPGCAFRERCPRADASCTQDPAMHNHADGRVVRCFHPLVEEDTAV